MLRARLPEEGSTQRPPPGGAREAFEWERELAGALRPATVIVPALPSPLDPPQRSLCVHRWIREWAKASRAAARVNLRTIVRRHRPGRTRNLGQLARVALCSDSDERQHGAGGGGGRMNDESPILEVRQSAWQLSSVRDQRLRIFGDRVELVRPKYTSEARMTTIPLADIDYISVKPFLMVWFDLVIVPKSGAAMRLRPLARSDAEHAEELINRQVQKLRPP
jgi:hypothetical protein